LRALFHPQGGKLVFINIPRWIDMLSPEEWSVSNTNPVCNDRELRAGPDLLGVNAAVRQKPQLPSKRGNGVSNLEAAK
jgi:hypothetical protein